MGRRMVDIPLSHRFCHYPFRFAEIHGDGNVYFCCPTWCGYRSIGNIFKDSPAAIWNGIAAQTIRAGIIDGSFSGCEQHICPSIVSRKLPLKTAEDETSTSLMRGPQTVKLCHDSTCNLTCPSCRRNMITADRERQRQLDRMVHEFIVPFLADTQWLYLSGDGDPFASRHYRDVLRETAGNLSLRIKLHTNAVLCDARAWDDCCLQGRVDEVLVSIDAATPETYAVVRRGGDFARLRRNLDFIARKRADGEVREFVLAFVVQTGNFREMPEFVRLGNSLGVDAVFFSEIQHWGRAMTDEEFGEAQVWRDDHPLRSELSAVLRDPIFADHIVHLGNVR
jgi:pyruvate-formate lyase-activating enzyme